jgi:uroporphyrinogen-III synthase
LPRDYATRPIRECAVPATAEQIAEEREKLFGDQTKELLSSLGFTQEWYCEAKSSLGFAPACWCPERIEYINKAHRWLRKKLYGV